MPFLGYGLGIYRDRVIDACGIWFGFGQAQLRRWALDVCLFKQANGYNKYWFTMGKENK